MPLGGRSRAQVAGRRPPGRGRRGRIDVPSHRRQPGSHGPVVPSGGIRANSLIRRRVMLGASRASPPATTRIAVIRSAGRVSLSRNPLAPARSAPNTYSSRSKVVRMITRTPASDSGADVIWRVASMPSSIGIRTSISMTSGRAARATATASAPLAASPTTVEPFGGGDDPAEPDPDEGLIVGDGDRDRHAPIRRRPSPSAAGRFGRLAAGWRSPGTRPRPAAGR